MAQSVNDRNFHITIGAYPSGEISLESELPLVKAALLYADRVKLFSPKASMVEMISKLGEITHEQQLKAVTAKVAYKLVRPLGS